MTSDTTSNVPVAADECNSVGFPTMLGRPTKAGEEMSSNKAAMTPYSRMGDYENQLPEEVLTKIR